ncbi:pol polyprotein [Aphelenchoides avenae]|nr:pol polyprotein [Aphelenchus avenae]
MAVSRNSHVFHKVGIDLSGPYKTTERENRYVMNMVCWYSKFLISVPLPDMRAVTVARALLENCVLRYGACVELVSDNGSCFTAECFREFCALLGINKVYSVPWHSQGNALTERTFRVVQDMLAKMVSANQEDWDTMLVFTAFSYNVSVHESTGETPFFLNHARDPLFAIDLALDPRTRVSRDPETDVEEFRSQLIQRLRQSGELVREQAAKASARQKERYDHGIREQDLTIGDRVFLKNFATKRGLSRKLDLPWKGLYRIVNLTDTHAEIVQIGRGDQAPRKVNRDQIKKGLGIEDNENGTVEPMDQDDREAAGDIHAQTNPNTELDQLMVSDGDCSEEEYAPGPQVTRYGRQTRAPDRFQ